MTKLTSLKWYLIFAGCCIAGASKFLGLEIPIRVKCWFCPHKQTVKFSQRNSWDCQSCSQYNGFNKDGDYNKEINGQHSEIPVHPKVNITWLSDLLLANHPVRLIKKCNQTYLA